MKLPSLGINQLFPKLIWQQIFFILFFLVVIPLVILGILLLNASRDSIKTTVLRDHKEIAIHATGEIREHVQGAHNALLVTAAILGTLHADPWRQETTIVELSLRSSTFQRIASVDFNGKEIVTSELGTALSDHSKEEAFLQALQGHSFRSEVKISANHMPYITLAEPIVRLGKVKGVLLADLSLRSVWDIVDAIHIGKEGRAYLIDQQGRIIAHPDKKLVLKNANLQHLRVLEDLWRGQSGNLEEKDDSQRLWLTSYAPINKLNWGLIISQPQQEAFALLRQMSFQAILLISLSILGSLFISFFLAHYMSRPIREMIAGTERIARGDFSYAFSINNRTEISKLFQSFNQMTQRLKKAQEEEKLSIIGKAATAVAHELKNSLQLVDTFVKLLPERYRDKKFIKDFSETIPRELDSWNTSLKNMLAYAKNSQFPLTPIDINETIKDIALLASLKTRQMDIAFEVNLSEQLPLILGNGEKLKQVFLNLLNNALEATPPGGKIQILSSVAERFSQERKDLSSNDAFKLGANWVRIEVANSGESISDEHLHRIFEPFFSTKSGGLGLGLSICKEIVESHQGNIVVQRPQQGGTSFIIEIPSCLTLKPLA